MKISILSVFVIVSLLGSLATAAGECINLSSIRGYDPQSPTSLTIRTNNAKYNMAVYHCSELTWAQKIGFETFSSFRVCARDKLLVIDNWNNNIKQTCYIRKIEKIN